MTSILQIYCTIVHVKNKLKSYGDWSNFNKTKKAKIDKMSIKIKLTNIQIYDSSEIYRGSGIIET